LELCGGCNHILAIWHPVYHNHEHSIWPLREANSLAWLLAHSHKSIASRLFALIPSFLTFRILLPHLPSPSTAGESIQDYCNYATAASSGMTPKDLQLPSPRAGVHLESITSSSAPRLWTHPSSWITQPPIPSSTCWTHYSWPAPSIWQIAWRRIRFASGWLVVCIGQRRSPTNPHSHHVHHN
jgi:hypothetical protein